MGRRGGRRTFCRPHLEGRVSSLSLPGCRALTHFRLQLWDRERRTKLWFRDHFWLCIDFLWVLSTGMYLLSPEVTGRAVSPSEASSGGDSMLCSLSWLRAILQFGLYYSNLGPWLHRLLFFHVFYKFLSFPRKGICHWILRQPGHHCNRFQTGERAGFRGGNRALHLQQSHWGFFCSISSLTKELSCLNTHA